MQTLNDTAPNCTTFASTFYFFADTQIKAKKIKRACKPTHGGQCKLDTTDLRPENTTTHNTGLAKEAVQCSADKFVVKESSVLRINICGENRHLRQARNRCALFDIDIINQ